MPPFGIPSEFNEIEDQKTRDNATAFKEVSILISYTRSISYIIAILTSNRQLAACQTHRKTEFMDMNTDCHLLIFKYLNFATLISLSATSKNLSAVAGEVLKRRFTEKTLTISIPYFFGKMECNVFEENDKIALKNYETISVMLTQHGHLIRKLKIDHSLAFDRDAHLIYRNISLYCAETLQELYIKSAGEHFFNEFEKPFRNLEILSLTGRFNELAKIENSLSGMFPTLRHLILDVMSPNELNSIVSNDVFPHLEYLKFIVRVPLDSSESLLCELIKQIRKVQLHHISPKILQFLANQMPNLEMMEMILRNNQIHFEHLKILKIPHLNIYPKMSHSEISSSLKPMPMTSQNVRI